MPTLSKDIYPGRFYCHTCRQITVWNGDRVQNCYECGMRFPCAKLSCTHEDCKESRKYWGTGDWTDVFPGLEQA